MFRVGKWYGSRGSGTAAGCLGLKGDTANAVPAIAVPTGLDWITPMFVVRLYN